jgi:iron complex outermembrane receptor protein
MKLCNRLILYILLAFTTFVRAETTLHQDRDTISELRTLGLAELLEVDIILDDTFDVFNSLVTNQDVSIATGKGKSTSLAPAVTSVITAMDIEAMGADTLTQVLETVPGLHVMQSDISYLPIYLMRGISSFDNAEILVLLNGMPLNTFQKGHRGPMWRELSVRMIQRVEIMRGPGSALFGADAFAGVINIITKTAQDIKQSEVGLRAGNFDNQRGWLLHSENWLGFDIGIMVDKTHTGGYQGLIEADLQTTLDKRNNTQASYAPGRLNLDFDSHEIYLDIIRDSWHWRVGYLQTKAGGSFGISHILDPFNEYKAERINTDITYHNPYFTDNWDVTAQISYYHRDYGSTANSTVYSPGAVSENAVVMSVGVTERQTQATISGFYKGFDKHQLHLGIGYRYNDVYKTTLFANFGRHPVTGEPVELGGELIDMADSPSIFLPENDRKNSFAFIQDNWQLIPNWELTAGVRYDHYSDFGSTTNPRMALVWQTTPQLISKLLYGQAFRAPTLSDLSVSNNPVLQGNPNLIPEKLKMWELAFNYQLNQRMNWAWNIFNYSIEDRIISRFDERSIESTAYIYDNVGIQQGKGFEIETRWKVSPRFSLLANYAWQTSKNQDGHILPYTPRHQAYLRTDWMLAPEWYLDTQVNWIAERPRNFDDPRSEIGDYTNVDLTLYYKSKAFPNWHVKVGVRNAFDREQRTPSLGPDNSGIIAIPYDLPLAKRHYFMELRYRF